MKPSRSMQLARSLGRGAHLMFALVAGLSIVGVLSGCVSSEASSDKRSSTAVAVSVAQARREVLALSVNDGTLSDAVQKADVACLRAADITVNVPDNVMSRSSSGNLLGVLGIFNSIRQASTEGYAGYVQSGSSGSLGRGPAFNAKQFGTRDQLVTVRAPLGIVLTAPKNGCLASARALVYGSIDNFLMLEAVRPVLSERAPEPPKALGAAFEDYSNCMARAHVQTRGPQDTLALVQKKFASHRSATDEPSVQERAFAKVDAGCQLDAELLKQINATWLTANESWIASNKSWIHNAFRLRERVIAGTRK